MTLYIIILNKIYLRFKFHTFFDIPGYFRIFSGIPVKLSYREWLNNLIATMWDETDVFIIFVHHSDDDNNYNYSNFVPKLYEVIDYKHLVGKPKFVRVV